jgi:hypothetical protein
MSVVDVNALVLKLVEVATAALSGDVQVLDGRDYSAEVEKHAVLVGHAGNPSTPVVEVLRSVTDGGIDASLFDVAVRGTVAVWDGEEEFASKRAAAQSTIAALNAAVEANVRLDGLAMEAFMSPEMAWFQVADTEGNSVEVDFTITARVFA